MKLRHLLILAAVAGLTASFALWGHLLFAPVPTFKPSAAPLNPAWPVGSPNLVVAKILTSRLPAGLAFAGPFEPAVRHLTESIGHGKTVFRWNALRAAGVTPQTPVSLDASGLLFPNALDAILEHATRGTRLKYVIDANTFIISTEADLSVTGTIWTYDITPLHDHAYLDRMGFPGPIAERITAEVLPGTWVDVGRYSKAGVTGYNPRTSWPDAAPDQGFIRYASPRNLFVSHSPAAIEQIPIVLRHLFVRQNRLIFADETLRLTGSWLIGVTIVHFLFRLRHARPRLAALLLAHAVTCYALAARLTLQIDYNNPHRHSLIRSTWELVPPLDVPVTMASATPRLASLPPVQLAKYWAYYVVPAAIVYAICHRRFVPRSRVKAGLCVNCGYDLRATPERCPECGTPVAGAPAAATA